MTRGALPLLVLLLLALPSCDRRSSVPRDAQALVGQPAPALSFTALQNTDVRSLADLEGRTVVVELWATWCTPCRDSLPALSEAFRSLDGDPYFLAVNVDARSPNRADEVRHFLQQHAPLAPAVLDDGRAVGLLAARAIPFTAILDADGVVHHVKIGVYPPEHLVELALQVRDAQATEARPR